MNTADPNPYQSPNYGTLADGAAENLVYYKALSTKLTHTEYRRIAKNPFELLVGIICKTLRLRFPQHFAFADASHFRRVDPQQVSEQARKRVQPVVDEALDAGLKYGFSYWLPSVGTVEGIAVAMYSDDGRICMTIIYVRTWTRLVDNEKVVSACVSWLADGQVLITCASRQELESPPNHFVEEHPDRPLSEVLARHRERLDETLQPATVIHSVDDLEQTLRNYEQDHFTFQIERGVYVPVTAAEAERLARAAERLKPQASHPRLSANFGREVLFILMLIALLLILVRGPAANQVELTLRWVVGVGVIVGLTMVWLMRLRRWLGLSRRR